tara:strand:- start:89 stop:370 length:282 start_codon:yes stop_codon:yes gene_type:complete
MSLSEFVEMLDFRLLCSFFESILMDTSVVFSSSLCFEEGELGALVLGAPEFMGVSVDKSSICVVIVFNTIPSLSSSSPSFKLSKVGMSNTDAV